jgi:hypothetical protein
MSKLIVEAPSNSFTFEDWKGEKNEFKTLRILTTKF